MNPSKWGYAPKVHKEQEITVVSCTLRESKRVRTKAVNTSLIDRGSVSSIFTNDYNSIEKAESPIQKKGYSHSHKRQEVVLPSIREKKQSKDAK